MDFFKRSKFKPTKPFKRIKRFGKKPLLDLIQVLFMVIIPTTVVVVGTFLVVSRDKPVVNLGDKSGEIPQDTILLPSQVLGDRYRLKDQELVIKGRVKNAPVVCDRGDCPPGDPCCQCPEETNLLIADPGVSLVGRAVWQLPIIDSNLKSLCQRVPGECEYQCPGWKKGNVYQILGVLKAEPPPRGSAWQTFLETHIIYTSKKNLGRPDIFTQIETIAKELKDTLTELGGAGSFVVE